MSHAKVTATFRGVAYYNERTAPYNITLGFTESVDGLAVTSFRGSRCSVTGVFLWADSGKKMYFVTVQPSASSSSPGGLEQSCYVQLLQDSVDQGNEQTTYMSQYSETADQRPAPSVSAPSYYVASQKTLTVNIVFQRGPTDASDYVPLQPARLRANGATISSVVDRCTFGECYSWDVTLQTAAANPGDIRFVVLQDAIGADSNGQLTTFIRFDGSGTQADGVTLSWQGNTDFGPETSIIYCFILVTPPVDTANIT